MTAPLKTCSFLAAWAVIVLGISLSIVGCSGKPQQGEEFGAATEVAPAQDHFTIAMRFFRQLDEFDPSLGRKQVLDNLNRWVEDQPADTDWKPDPMLARIPEPWNGLEPLKNPARLDFGPDDLDYLTEASWMRDITRWVSAQPLDPFLAKRLPGADEGLSEAEIERLAVAMRLFDWTIRNLQLEPLLPVPKPAAAGPRADPQKPDQLPPPPPFQAVPGPGYQQFPFQTLLMGRGDAWERARVFILLCRQEGIDVVMLGRIEGAPTSPPIPWLPAVVIKDRLYLFDTSLGLPIPGPGDKGVATLAQVVADPKLLRNLDLDEKEPYAMSAEMLTQVVALVDAAPEALLRRMQLAEARLTGEDRMTLTVAPTKIKDRVAKTPGISGVQLWLVPFETIVYRITYMQAVNQNPAALLAFYREEGPFQTLNPLVLGRHQHFRGMFDAADQRAHDAIDDPTAQDSGRERATARTLYLSARFSDEFIRQFETSEELQRRQGLVKSDQETPEVWSERRRATIDGMRNLRHHAAYFLGLTHFERRNYPTAIDWFQRRTLDADPDGPWTHGARYNLARIYEAQGDLAAARDLYYADESPQKNGNRLRGTWLD